MMKQILKKTILRFRLGQNVWNYIAIRYRKIRRICKRSIQKKKDFNQYVYPIIGKHPRKENAFLVLSPTYRNLGDHAIAKSEMDFFEDCGFAVKEVAIDIIQILAKYDDYAVFGRSTVFVTGGGFLGTLWTHMHEMTSNIIKNNPNAKIVILPNTLYFEQTQDGDKLFDESLEIFNLPNVKRVYLREKASYNLVRDKYTSAKLAPDMVMNLDETQKGVQRKGCLVCLRDDKEKTLSESQTNIVFEEVKQLFGNDVATMNMRYDTDVSLDERMEKLTQKFDQFRHAELVITDRLHGMIFAAITGTPCIVMNSRSHKLIGCYEWLKHLDYIRFCDNAEDISKIYAEIPQGVHQYDVQPLAPWFDEMRNDLISIISE